MSVEPRSIAQGLPVGAGDTLLVKTKPLPREDLQHVLAHTKDLWQTLDQKRLFITGGTGFFGLWLLETIAFANDQLGVDVRATILSRNPQPFLNRLPHLAGRTEFDWLVGDPTSFAFLTTKHDYLLHLATATSAHLGQTNALKMLHTKLHSISHVLAFARHAEIQRVLVTSSGAVYGQQPADLQRVPESYSGAPDPMNAASAYGNGKRLIEQICALAVDLDIVIARCFSFIGPHLPLDARFAAGNFIRNALDQRTIVVQSDGRAVRSYLYASDLTIWLLHLLLRGEPNRVYNVGSDDAISVSELAALVAAQRQLAVEILGKNDAPQTLANRYVPDVSRCANELSLRPIVSLPDAIAKTLGWCEIASA